MLEYCTTMVDNLSQVGRVDTLDDIDRAYEIQAEVGNQVIEQLRADRKAEKEARREDRRAALKAQFEEYEAATNRSMGFE